MEKLLLAKFAHVMGAAAGVALMFTVIKPNTPGEGFSRALVGSISVWLFTDPIVIYLMTYKFFSMAGIISTTIIVSTFMMFAGWFFWALIARTMDAHRNDTLDDLVKGRKSDGD